MHSSTLAPALSKYPCNKIKINNNILSSNIKSLSILCHQSIDSKATKRQFALYLHSIICNGKMYEIPHWLNWIILSLYFNLNCTIHSRGNFIIILMEYSFRWAHSSLSLSNSPPKLLKLVYDKIIITLFDKQNILRKIWAKALKIQQFFIYSQVFIH